MIPTVETNIEKRRLIKDDRQPITFLHAETSDVQLIDQPEKTFLAETDTLNPLSGDSDTR